MDNFYDFYLSQHQNGWNRVLHFLGTSLSIFFLILTFLQLEVLWLGAALLSGYLFAWVGHFFIEKNRPATFKYPLASLASDFRLYYELLSRQRKFFESHQGSSS